MSVRSAAAGKTRSCPHCRATILESASVCPACLHHLRFDPRRPGQREQAGEVAFRIDGGFQHPPGGQPCEYSVVVVVRDDRGEEIGRKVVSVGSLAPGESRGVELQVQVSKPRG